MHATVVVPLNIATACICFWYHLPLHLWPLPTDAFLLVYHRDTLSTSCNLTERNMMDSSRVTERSVSSNPSFFTYFFQKFRDISLPKCGGGPSCYSHIRPRISRGTSSKYRGNLVPRTLLQYRVVEHPSKTCGPVGLLSNSPHHILCPRVRNVCVGNTTLSKLRLIREQNAAGFVAGVAAARGWCDLPVYGVALFVGDMV
jgi:hypothetical protein